MAFTAGTFEKFRVVHQIHLGKFMMDLPKDAIIEFDGQVLKYGGKDYAEPIVSGALKAGWVVPVADTTSKFVAQNAGVQVRPATAAGQERGESMKIDAASAEEEVVGSLTATNNKRTGATQTPKVAASTATVTKPPEAGSVSITKSEPVPTEVSYNLPKSDGQSSEGVAVARIGSSPVQKTILTDERQVSAAIAKTEAGGPVKTKKFAVVKSDEDQAAADADQKAFRGPVARVKANDDAEGGTPISKVAKNGATGDVDVARSAGEDLSELLPDAVSSGVPAPTVAKFSWDMKPHWRNRVKTAIDKYGSDPVALKAIYAVEVESVVKHIKSGLNSK